MSWNHLGQLASVDEAAGDSGGFFSLAECKSNCLADPTCYSFAFATGNGHCATKSSIITSSSAIMTPCIACGCQCYTSYYLSCPPPPPAPPPPSSTSCTVRVDSKGWYDGGATYARFYVNNVEQDFSNDSGTAAGQNSYDWASIFEGHGTYGFNFVRIR